MELLTTKQTADRLGLHQATIVRYLHDGTLAGRQLPGQRGQWLVDPASIEAYQAVHRGRNATPRRDGYLAVGEAAKRLGVSRTMIYYWRDTGKLKLEQVDGYWYVPVEELET